MDDHDNSTIDALFRSTAQIIARSGTLLGAVRHSDQNVSPTILAILDQQQQLIGLLTEVVDRLLKQPRQDQQQNAQQSTQQQQGAEPTVKTTENDENRQEQGLIGAVPAAAEVYAFKVAQNEPVPVQFPADAAHGRDIPKGLKRIADLPHGDAVSAVTMAPNGQHVFTGGKGTVKMWDLVDNWLGSYMGWTSGWSSSAHQVLAPLSTFQCLKDSYIRSCKLFADSSTLIVGGETRNICLWDLANGKVKTTLDCEAEACYTLALTADSRLCFSGCSDGSVIIWDLRSEQRIIQLEGHTDGASCVDLSGDGMRLWTGGLDNTVRCWDIGERTEMNKFVLESQIFSLGCSPTEDWVAVGMENNNVEVLHMNRPEKYVLDDHQSCVLSLKFAHNGKWFVSTGKDNVVNCWRTPYGFRLLKSKENSSVLSCDVSSDDRYLLTGSGDKKASLHELCF